MELKEQLNTIREVIRENIDHGKLVDAIMTAVAAYGNNCYNQGVDDAARYIANNTDPLAGLLHQSILNLKKH